MTEPRIIVYIDHDDCMDSPCENDGWKAYSFSHHHSNFKRPSDLGLDVDPDIDPDLRVKLDAGLAFILSYFEHGNCIWSLQGDGPSCRFDSVGVAGLLVWEQDADDLGPKTLEERQKDAAAFLETFTEWCNGECYHYRAVKVRNCPTCNQEETVDENFDSCGGFIGADSLCEGIRESLGDGPFEWRGDAAGIMEFFAWKEATNA